MSRTRTSRVLIAGVAMLGLVVAGGGTMTVRAAGAGVLPDVIEEVPSHLHIQNTQQREFLRFTTVHVNIGAGNLQIRGGGQIAPCKIDGIDYAQCTVATQEILDANRNIVATHPSGVACFHPEHNHWHQSAVAEFAIRRTIDGPAISAGTKITFCFVDVEFTGLTGNQKKAKPRTYFDCNGTLQGLASGWADSSHQSTPLQELDITGLAVGTYYLTYLADPDNHWLESNESNNFTWVKFKLTRTGANPEVTVIDHSPCVPQVMCGFGGNP
ncbi:MAG: lysyl oxidase family protein [Ilumatobacteraceae bacterium]